MKKSIRIVILILCLIFIGWVIYMADNNKKAFVFDLVRVIPYGDKLGHISLFGLLTLIINIALNFRKVKSKIYNQYLGTLLIAIIVLLEEISQHFIIHRTFDLMDLIADAIGILLFTYLTSLLESKLKI